MKTSDVFYMDIVNFINVSRPSDCFSVVEQGSRTALHMFNRLCVAVQDLERDPGRRREALMGHVERTPIDGAGQHCVSRKGRLVVPYPLPESLLGGDLGRKVSNHELVHGRKSVGDVLGQG